MIASVFFRGALLQLVGQVCGSGMQQDLGRSESSDGLAEVFMAPGGSFSAHAPISAGPGLMRQHHVVDAVHARPVTSGAGPHAAPVQEHVQDLVSVWHQSAAKHVRHEADLKSQHKLQKQNGEDKQNQKKDQNPPDDLLRKVSCGGHMADNCNACTTIDPKTGAEKDVAEGPTWCNGDCTYYDGRCQELTIENKNIPRTNATADATTTQSIPDILNPEITDWDRNVIHEAADRSIQEADYEAKMKLANIEHKQEEKGSKNILYYAIITFSVVMVCFAIASVVVAVKLSKGQSKQPLVPQEDAGAEAEGVEDED